MNQQHATIESIKEQYVNEPAEQHRNEHANPQPLVEHWLDSRKHSAAKFLKEAFDHDEVYMHVNIIFQEIKGVAPSADEFLTTEITRKEWDDFWEPLKDETTSLHMKMMDIFEFLNGGGDGCLSAWEFVTNGVPEDFFFCEQKSKYGSHRRRILALVAHDNMKPTMKRFIKRHISVLRHFRISGTQTTTRIVNEFLGNDSEFIPGPTCPSGPLGGNAKLAAMVAEGEIGGIIFFIDPLSQHPHQSDIHSLCRICETHDILFATNPATAELLMRGLESCITAPHVAPCFYQQQRHTATIKTYMSTRDTIVTTVLT